MELSETETKKTEKVNKTNMLFQKNKIDKPT
jgi:hypothetical protein